MTENLKSLAHQTERAARQADARIGAADEWLNTHTPTGYPNGGRGDTTSGGEPSSPVLAAIINLPHITVAGEPITTLAAQRLLHARLTGALLQLEDALAIIDAIPRAPSGEAARRTDYELRTGRCEGWTPKYALCEDLSVHGTTVNGSTMRLCGRCYLRMWRETEPGPQGRQTRKAPR